jgi:hypothetical protein
MRFFLTNKRFREAVLREASDPSKDPAYLLKLYSENPVLLKKALAAHENVPEAALAHLNVSDSSLLLNPMKRALRAFAEGLQQERASL